jgi:hypothetical protein
MLNRVDRACGKRWRLREWRRVDDSSQRRWQQRSDLLDHGGEGLAHRVRHSAELSANLLHHRGEGLARRLGHSAGRTEVAVEMMFGQPASSIRGRTARSCLGLRVSPVGTEQDQKSASHDRDTQHGTDSHGEPGPPSPDRVARSCAVDAGLYNRWPGMTRCSSGGSVHGPRQTPPGHSRRRGQGCRIPSSSRSEKFPRHSKSAPAAIRLQRYIVPNKR